MAMQGAAQEMPVHAEGLETFAAIDVTFLLTSP